MMETNKLVIGILAHVDSGKTTLAEDILYQSGSIRKLGRVDHKDTFLDNNELERVRGITIFAKQSQFTLGNKEICLLDTPGHVDFSAEMERTLQVLDYAILIISGPDGVQGHTQTLWRLLKRYEIPTFIFVNKMDQEGTQKGKLLQEIKKQLDERCVDFAENTEMFYEEIAMCDEEMMNSYLEEGTLQIEQIQCAVRERKLFPCFFGSALKQEGVDEFLREIDKYTVCPKYTDVFGARVFKIARDDQGNRMTFMKVTGGTLKAKMVVKKNRRNEKNTVKSGELDTSQGEKVDQIRIYSGSQYVTATEVTAGTICAVMGMNATTSGEGLGAETDAALPILEPVLTYRINTPKEINAHAFFLHLRQLEEEEPELHVVWNDSLGEIHVQVMGEVQIEILKSLIQERFHVEVTFDSGNIVYKETIKDSVIGIGHFEPLRHYAEVHLLMEPLERGSGLEFATNCSEDILDKNWQRLIMTHLEEKKHRGVLTGSEITDMRITLITGRAHIKHTEGGDFRQATYRAVRQGLKSAECVLLEPVYEFQLELPQDLIGRAMSDIQRMYGNFDTPAIENGIAIMTGTCPVSTMRDYHREVIAYSRGYGRLFCTLKGYELCHNQDEVIEKMNYDSEKDLENPTGSVFCAHGAGFTVPWHQVAQYAHMDNGINEKNQEEEPWDFEASDSLQSRKREIAHGVIAQEEIDEIFARTFGSAKQKRRSWAKTITSSNDSTYKGTENNHNTATKEEYLLVDGYNIIFAWNDLNELAKDNIDSARDKLMDIMCNYQGYKKCHLILVFDAYKVAGGKGEVFAYHNIHVVYTKEAETADQYIEKVSHELASKYRVTVATSDRLEQMIIWGAGANRLSAQGLWEEVQMATSEIRSRLNEQKPGKNYLENQLSEASIEMMEKMIENAADSE